MDCKNVSKFSTPPSFFVLCCVPLGCFHQKVDFISPTEGGWAELWLALANRTQEKGQYAGSDTELCGLLFSRRPLTLPTAAYWPPGASWVLPLKNLPDLPTCQLSADAWASPFETSWTGAQHQNHPANSQIGEQNKCLFLDATEVWWLLITQWQ